MIPETVDGEKLTNVLVDTLKMAEARGAIREQLRIFKDVQKLYTNTPYPSLSPETKGWRNAINRAIDVVLKENVDEKLQG